MPKHKRTRAELVQILRDQLALLEATASTYDDGLEAAANLLAVTIRTLVYDKPGSPSVNGQLGLATTLRFKDTAAPINPRNLLDTPGLVMMTTTFGVGAVTPPRWISCRLRA
ncbi:MAG: hypothetical protein H0U90_03685 [Actinobacteria bacterium]|nr:hypothetical protein [Actinomycetota bacterium]